MKTLKINQPIARDMIRNYHGRQFFTVTFVKRTTGEIRTMNCRKGVRKGIRGEGLRFSPAQKRLVSVYDMAKGQFRFVSLDEIRRISLQGKVFEVVKG